MLLGSDLESKQAEEVIEVVHLEGTSVLDPVCSSLLLAVEHRIVAALVPCRLVGVACIVSAASRLVAGRLLEVVLRSSIDRLQWLPLAPSSSFAR